MSNSNSVTFDVIYTFEGSPQLQGEVLFAGRPSEAQVLKGLLNGLSTKETAKLVKLSLCQMNCDRDGVLPWVERSTTQCKYYFDGYVESVVDVPEPISV
jgi:hypothetical protein